MIDIHSHIIPNVDDGSDSLEKSLLLIEEEFKLGVTDVICTPHFRKGVFQPTVSEIKENFQLLSSANKTPVNLYLGQEISVFSGMYSLVKSGELLTMNSKPYVLLEFPYAKCSNLTEMVYDAKYSGFTPIIAHIERYEYVKPTVIEKLKQIGAVIQVNADSLISKKLKRYGKRVKQYIKDGYVDIVASDIHATRQNYLKEAYLFVEKNFGEQTAQELFNENAKTLL